MVQVGKPEMKFESNYISLLMIAFKSKIQRALLSSLNIIFDSITWVQMLELLKIRTRVEFKVFIILENLELVKFMGLRVYNHELCFV